MHAVQIRTRSSPCTRRLHGSPVQRRTMRFQTDIWRPWNLFLGLSGRRCLARRMMFPDWGAAREIEEDNSAHKQRPEHHDKHEKSKRVLVVSTFWLRIVLTL